MGESLEIAIPYDLHLAAHKQTIVTFTDITSDIKKVTLNPQKP